MRSNAGDLFTHLNKDDRMATLRFVISDSGYFLQIRWLDAFLYKEGSTARIHATRTKCRSLLIALRCSTVTQSLALSQESDQNCKSKSDA